MKKGFLWVIVFISIFGHFRYQIPGDAEWANMMLQKIRTYNMMR